MGIAFAPQHSSMFAASGLAGQAVPPREATLRLVVQGRALRQTESRCNALGSGRGGGFCPLQPACLGEIDPKPVAPTLVFAGHLGRGMAQLLLQIALVHLGRGRKAGAQ